MSTAQDKTADTAAPDAADAAAAAKETVLYNFRVSEIPKNPLGEGNYIKTAGCLIIGCALESCARVVAIDMLRCFLLTETKS